MIVEDVYLVAYCGGKTKKGSLLYMSGLPRKLTETDKNLVEIFFRNVQVVFDNILLNKDIEDTQREIIERLADVMETSYGSKNHTKRMVKICDILGRAAKLSEEDLKRYA